jgi:hypothetical protein
MRRRCEIEKVDEMDVLRCVIKSAKIGAMKGRSVGEVIFVGDSYASLYTMISYAPLSEPHNQRAA